MPHQRGLCWHNAPMANETTSYFFPGAGSVEQAEQYREAVVRFARDNGFPATPRRIFRLSHSVDGVERQDEVGQLEGLVLREVIC